MQRLLADQRGLDIRAGAAEDLVLDGAGRVAGVVTGERRDDGAGAVVLTTGTFLRGLIHMGEEKIPAGRVGEAPSIGLAETLARLGFRLGPAEDRDAAAARRQDDRLGGADSPARRRSAAAVFLPDRAITTPQMRLPHHRAPRRRPMR